MRDVQSNSRHCACTAWPGPWGDLQEQGPASGCGCLALAGRAPAAGRDHGPFDALGAAYQMSSARFPVHRGLAGFDFDASVVDQKLIHQLAMLEFTEAAHNVVLGRWSGHRQDPSGNGSGRVGHHAPRQARAVLLNGRSGQCPGAGEGPGQGRAYRAMSLLRNGCGDPGRAGLPAVQPGRRRAAVPPVVQAVRAHQRGDHDQPGRSPNGRRWDPLKFVQLLGVSSNPGRFTTLTGWQGDSQSQIGGLSRLGAYPVSTTQLLASSVWRPTR
jgi:hypothetical protein